jgi:molybdopterin-guanine dinucleotide biosynthesis protein A
MSDLPTRVTAVVLAGGGVDDPLAARAGVSSKALVPMAGQPMAAWVLRALESSTAVAQVIYVGEGLGELGPSRAQAVPGGLGYAQSLALGIGAGLATRPGVPLLVSTADIPWLTPEAVDRFVSAAGSADLAYPVVSEEAALAEFPTQRRTFVRLRQGRFTGGNLMLLRPSLVGPLLDLIDSVYRARKNPLALAGLVGPRTLLALLLGRADLRELERIVSGRLGGIARAVVCSDACLAADVDRIEHLAVPARVSSVR